MTGRLVGIVGPSGAGKDSVMEAMAAAWPEVSLVRRVITRPADSNGEVHEAVTQDEFDRRRKAKEFCLHWQAHGLSYGIPNTVLRRTLGGGDCVVNLSRGVLAEAKLVFPSLVVLNITAKPAVLAARLDARGREDAEQIDQRLRRRAPAWPDGVKILTVENDGRLDDTVQRALALLNPEKV